MSGNRVFVTQRERTAMVRRAASLHEVAVSVLVVWALSISNHVPTTVGADTPGYGVVPESVTALTGAASRGKMRPSGSRCLEGVSHAPGPMGSAALWSQCQGQDGMQSNVARIAEVIVRATLTTGYATRETCEGHTTARSVGNVGVKQSLDSAKSRTRLRTW